MTGFHPLAATLLAALLLMAISVAPIRAQDTRVRDLVLTDAAPATRLMGFGLVTGLNGTGDRVTGMYGSRQTVQSIVNLLRRFDVEVPAAVLRTRNVAAVLVTAEVSPYLRPGGRFEVSVSSLGDALSLRGGILWMTPLVAEAGGRPFAAAQGALLMSASDPARRSLAGGTAGRIPDGGALEVELPRPAAALATKLLLREPDTQTATRIVAAIDSAFGGPGNATIEDPGSIALTLKDTSTSFLRTLAKVRELRVRTSRAARIVIDGRDGTIVAGGDLLVGEAVVSHGGITLSIGASADSATAPGDVRVPTGTSVQRVASALHAMRATPSDIAAIFEALRGVGALSAEVVAR
jgi:flagellar P-ring protein precursor FlgI